MPAFVKLGDIKGEATDSGHKDWILIDSMSTNIHRSIVVGAKDQQRTKGDTTLGDVDMVRNLDKSSTKLQEACANGTFFKEVEIHFCTTVKNKQEPYLTYKLANAIVTSYSCSAMGSGDRPMESLSLNFTKAEWTYMIVDPETGEVKGNVPAKYEPGKGQA